MIGAGLPENVRQSITGAIAYVVRHYFIHPNVAMEDVWQEARLAYCEIADQKPSGALIRTTVVRRVLNFLRDDYCQRGKMALGWSETELENLSAELDSRVLDWEQGQDGGMYQGDGDANQEALVIWARR